MSIAIRASVLLLGGSILLLQPFAAYAQVPNVGSASAAYCPALTVTLQRGSRDSTTGGQVSELQRFISSYYGVPSSEIVTGYFGPRTESYVKRFQSEQGIPSIGIVGPMTRAAIARECGAGGGGAAPTSVTMTATPLSGTAPLVVAFSISVTSGTCGNYSMEYGDGATENLTNFCGNKTLQHTYTAQGDFSAHLDELLQSGGQIVRHMKAQAVISVGTLQNTAPTCTMNASKTIIKPNEEVTITWSSTNANTAKWSGGASTGTSGSAIFTDITSTVTKMLTFTGSGGTKSCSVTITVTPGAESTVVASGNAIANGGTVTVPGGGASAYKLAEFTLTIGSQEAVTLKKLVFTLRNQQTGGAAGAASLSNYRVTIGANSFTPTITKDGVYEEGTIAPASGLILTAGQSVAVSVFADISAMKAGNLDLWIYPDDVEVVGNTSNKTIKPTSTVTNRVDTALLYWSGWISTGAAGGGGGGCSYTSGNYKVPKGDTEVDIYSPGTAETSGCKITAEVVESYPDAHAAVVEFGIPLPMIQAVQGDPSRFQMLRFSSGQGSPFGLWPGSCPSADKPDAVATHFVLYGNSGTYYADVDPAGGNMCKIKMAITGPGVFEARLIDPRKACGPNAVSCPGYVLDSVRYTVQ